MMARRRSIRRLALRLLLGALAVPPAASAAEPYRPDPALVAAAKKEGQVLIYTTLIVDQIVRPLIRAFQAQVPGIDVKFVRADSVALVVRMTNEAKANRTQADIWQLVDGVGPLVEAGIAAHARPAERQGTARDLCRSRTGAGSRPISRCARSPTTPSSSRRRRRRAATPICSSRASRASSPGTRTRSPAPTASSAPCSSTWARRRASPICARSRSRTSRRCRWRSAPCSTA